MIIWIPLLVISHDYMSYMKLHDLDSTAGTNYVQAYISNIIFRLNGIKHQNKSQ